MCVYCTSLYAYIDYGMALMENDNKYVQKGTKWQRIWHTSASEIMCELEHSNVSTVHTHTRSHSKYHLIVQIQAIIIITHTCDPFAFIKCVFVCMCVVCNVNAYKYLICHSFSMRYRINHLIFMQLTNRNGIAKLFEHFFYCLS